MIYFLMPAYNEETEIGPRLRNISAMMAQKGFSFEIWVVNDGSNDQTVKIVEEVSREIPIHMIHHDKNQGIGIAFSNGLKKLIKVVRADDIIITLDADNTHNLKTVEFMLKKIDEGYEVVIGSCFTTGGMMIGAPLLRYLLSYLSNLAYRMLFHVKGIRTYTGFYRAHTGAAVQTAFEKFGDHLIEVTGFAAMAEMLIKFRQIPLFMTEVPMIIRYDMKGRASKMRVLATIQEHLGVIARNLFKRRVV
ncbi:MAG: glycosyltransferase family 2 protein [Thermodesulfobacteriota bacterium]|jgi:dolichol-phosphate mannosyltransferase